MSIKYNQFQLTDNYNTCIILTKSQDQLEYTAFTGFQSIGAVYPTEPKASYIFTFYRILIKY